MIAIHNTSNNSKCLMWRFNQILDKLLSYIIKYSDNLSEIIKSNFLLKLKLKLLSINFSLLKTMPGGQRKVLLGCTFI